MIPWLIGTLGGKATALAIIVAIIGVTGALGGALSTYIVARRTLYVNTITAERMKWVSLLRSNIATLIAQLTFIQVAKADRSKVSDEKLSDALFQSNQLAKTIELQLNPNGLIDSNIILVLKSMYKSTGRRDSVPIESLTNALVSHSQWLLKDEWERVKYEAMGVPGKIKSTLKSAVRKKRYLKFIETEEGIIPPTT